MPTWFDDKGDGFTLIWKIENFSYRWHTKRKTLESPVFKAKTLDNSNWKLCISQNEEMQFLEGSDNVKIWLERLEPWELNVVNVRTEIAILSPKGHVIIFDDDDYFHSHMGFCDGQPLFFHTRQWEKFKNKFSDDELTIRCRMWPISRNSTQPEYCIAHSRFLFERHLFSFYTKIKDWQVDYHYTKIYSPGIYKIINSDQDAHPAFTFSEKLRATYFDRDFPRNGVDIFLTREPEEWLRYVCLTVDVLNSQGNLHKTVSRLLEFPPSSEKETRVLQVCLDVHNFFNGKNDILQCCKLQMKVELLISTNSLDKEKDTCSYKDSLPENFLSHNVSVLVDPPEENENAVEMSHCCTMNKDFHHLLETKEFADLTLKTKTHDIHVHKLILKTRSPVFKAMLESDMVENELSTVKVDDIEYEILQKFVQYLYTERVDSVDCECVCKLYFAADKYEVVSLKKHCRDLLQSNLSIHNACDLLILGDRHHDEEMKQLVKTYIFTKKNEVLFTEKWNCLEKSHPALAIEIFHCIVKKTVCC